jgi:hypothetical protein
MEEGGGLKLGERYSLPEEVSLADPSREQDSYTSKET